jgi:leader peptidase (prepilin peptidase)/N-methyltransferase
LPPRLAAFSLVSAALPILLYPPLMIVPWQAETPSDWPPSDSFFAGGILLDAVMRIVTAVVAAVVMTRVLSRALCPTADPKLDPLGVGTARLLDLLVITATPMIVVGWQAAPAVVLLGVLFALASRAAFPRHPDAMSRLAIGMPAVLTVQLALWRLLNDSAYWPSPDCSPWVSLSYLAAVLFAAIWLRGDSAFAGSKDDPEFVDHSG